MYTSRCRAHVYNWRLNCTPIVTQRVVLYATHHVVYTMCTTFACTNNRHTWQSYGVYGKETSTPKIVNVGCALATGSSCFTGNSACVFCIYMNTTRSDAPFARLLYQLLSQLERSCSKLGVLSEILRNIESTKSNNKTCPLHTTHTLHTPYTMTSCSSRCLWPSKRVQALQHHCFACPIPCACMSSSVPRPVVPLHLMGVLVRCMQHSQQ